MRRISLLAALGILAFGLAAAPLKLISNTTSKAGFVHFESPHVHPAAMTPSGNRLLVVNTPDGYLRVFNLTGSQPTRVDDIPVGMEPISVSPQNDSIAWVVNHLSDDVSVVNLNTMHVKATIRVGDEPADVVFANGKAYVSVSQEDAIKVYDPSTLALLTTIPINGRMPRALAKRLDGSFVYVASFLGGNRVTVLGPEDVPVESLPPDPEFPMDGGLPPAPNVGLLVQRGLNPPYNWDDFYGNHWNHKVPYNLYDTDVAEINTTTDAVARTFGNLSSTNMALAVSATRILMTGQESRNMFRFEPRIVGYLVETVASFVTISSGSQLARRLDPHIDYNVVPGTQAEADSAIGMPTGAAFSGDGLRAYATSLATNKIAVLNPAGGVFTSVKARIPTVAGPTGIVVDDARHRLYVVGRFHNQLETIQADTLKSLNVVSIGFDPTPAEIVNGRKFLYQGSGSAHGDQACGTCHLFGDSDFESWDLGDPLGSYVPAPNPNPLGLEGFHPMKGPMLTQSLKGLTDLEPFHWRGDRVNLAAFNGAHVTLQGRESVLADSEMTAFTDFIMPMVYPPNPNQNLDRTMPDAPMGTPSALRGQDFFLNYALDTTGTTCSSCHTAANFSPGTNHVMIPDHVLGEDQDLKVPHLRNLYKKTGFVDAPGTNKRGFGFMHDGSMDQLSRVLTTGHTAGFSFGATPEDAAANRADLEAFLRCFDTGIAPSVGYQLTFDGTNGADPLALARADTLKAQATVGNCDLVARGRLNYQKRGWLYVGGDMWKSDKVAEADIPTATLLAFAGPGSEVTLTGVPPGAGTRMGIDRDGDGYLDGNERQMNSDPGDPNSIPGNVGVEPGPVREVFALRSIKPNPFRSAVEVSFTLGRRGPVDLVIYDVLGREVRAVARGSQLDAGPQSLTWDGRDRIGHEAGAGVYFVRLHTEQATWTRPVARVR